MTGFFVLKNIVNDFRNKWQAESILWSDNK